MTVAVILRAKGPEVVTLAGHATVGEAAAMLAERRIGAAPVVADEAGTNGGAVLGVFSERDVIACLAEHGAAGLDRSVADVMTAPAVTVGPDEPVIGALSLMTRRRVRHLPVTDGGRLVGIVSIGDLVKYRIDRIEADAAAMRSYIQSA